MPSRSWIEVPIDQEVWGVPESGYAPHSFPPEGDYLLFHFTEESFLRVLSALINGAALTYPDTWLQVVWDFLESVEYPVSLCEQIAACIATSDATRSAIRDLVISDPAINQHMQDIASETVLSLGERGKNLLKPGACDPGYTFNQASKLVFLLDQLSTDLFEAIEVGTNSLERASLLVGAIPIIGGLLPFDEAISLADNLVSNVAEDYAGAYDQGMYDDLRCGLWCTFKDTCDLDIDEALAYYQDKAGSSLPTNPVDTIAGIAQFLLSGDIPGDTTVYAMHLLVIAAMRAGQEMFGINFAQLGLRITAAGDDSDDDWEILCTECVEPSEWIKDIFTTGDMHDWEAVSVFAAFDDGWKNGAADTTQIGIKKAFTGQTVTDMRVYFDNAFAGPIDAQSLGNYNATDFIQMITIDYQMWEYLDMDRNAGIFLNFVELSGITGHKITEIWYKVAP